MGGLAKRNPAALRGRLMFAGAGEEEFWRLVIHVVEVERQQLQSCDQSNHGDLIIRIKLSIVV